MCKPHGISNYRASTLVVLTWENPVLYPLAEQHLENRLYIFPTYLNHKCDGMITMSLDVFDGSILELSYLFNC